MRIMRHKTKTILSKFLIVFVTLNLTLGLSNFLLATVDLESLSSDFVVELKQIEIPNHPYAFNPCIFKWTEGYLLTFREILSAKPFDYANGNSGLCHSLVGLVKLNGNFELISDPQILDTDFYHPHNSYWGAEDARLLEIKGKIYIIYSDNKDKTINEGSYRVYLAEIFEENDQFKVSPSICLSKFEGAKINRREKNWVPFACENTLLLGYSINPHRVLRPMTGGECVTLNKTRKEIFWPWGELRGGTPAQLVDGEYLAFFHSTIDMASIHSSNKMAAHYFMGAYTFENKLPFNLKKISTEPIIGKGFYSGKSYVPYWKPVNVVFPCGFVFDENFIWVSYGRQDHEMWLVKLDKAGLMSSLTTVSE